MSAHKLGFLIFLGIAALVALVFIVLKKSKGDHDVPM
jgi:hypothetical protein